MTRGKEDQRTIPKRTIALYDAQWDRIVEALKLASNIMRRDDPYSEFDANSVVLLARELEQCLAKKI